MPGRSLTSDSKLAALASQARGLTTTLNWLRPLARRWARLPVLFQDGVVGLLLAAIAVTFPGNGVVLGQLPQRFSGVTGTMIAVLLAAAQALPLSLRRTSTGWCLGLSAAAFGLAQFLGMPATPASLGLFVALFSAGSRQRNHERRRIAVATSVYLAFMILLKASGSPLRGFDAISFYLLLAACWGAGLAMRVWKDGEEQRRQAGVEQAIGIERARIAQELHDVVTHHVTAIVIQADMAYAVLREAQPPVARGLAAVSESGRQALTELRDLLHLLHAPDDRPDTPLAPLPIRLSELVERVRAAGQPIEFDVVGAPQSLSAERELTLYRVLQEALTNALKHAPRRRTVVRIDYGDPAGIIAEVTTATAVGPARSARTGVETPSAPMIRSGRGLMGLRQRVEAVGGELSVVAASDGGFLVRARLPA